MTQQIKDVRSVAPQCMVGDICRDAQCVRVVAAQGGRYFITMGHPGFNSRANNGNGYATATAAKAASARYGTPREQCDRERFNDPCVVCDRT